MCFLTIKIKEIAQNIFSAHQTKEQIEFIRHKYTLTEAEAYAVQTELLKKLTALHDTEIAGYKISMTSEETQAIANTHEPAYGTLLSTNIVHSGETLKLDNLFSPLIEPEIMFVLTDDLSIDADEKEIVEKSRVCAGIEIPDARYIDWFPNFSLADLLADNTATGLVVLSEEIEPLAIEAFENIQMALYHNDEKISEGISSAVLGNPVSAVAWLVKKLGQQSKRLKKGMVISSGTFISPLPANVGTYRVTYTNVGEVTITFK